MSEVPLTLADLALEKRRRGNGCISCFQVHMPPSREQHQKTPYLRAKTKNVGEKARKEEKHREKSF